MAETSKSAFDLLVCPLCGREIEDRERVLRCGGGHAFDVAKQGYVNLLPGDARPGTADDARMVGARERFLAAGHYAALAEAIGRAVPDGTGSVLDAGAGTGYHLAGVLDALPPAVGLALDISKFALRRAARAHPRLRAAVWDVWRPLPVRSGAVDLVLNVFAPRNPAEFRRVLSPGGALLVVTPAADHLAELRAARAGMLEVDADKAERLTAALTDSGLFRLADRAALSYPVTLDPDEAADAIGMGPSARHTERLAAADGPDHSAGSGGFSRAIPVTASFLVSTYRPA